MTTVDLSWKLRAQKAESENADLCKALRKAHASMEAFENFEKLSCFTKIKAEIDAVLSSSEAAHRKDVIQAVERGIGMRDTRIKSFDNTLQRHHVKALIGACGKYLEPEIEFQIFTPDVREVLTYLQAVWAKNYERESQ